MKTEEIQYESLAGNTSGRFQDCTIMIQESYENEYGTALHWHHGLEMNLLLKGHVICTVNGKEEDVFENELVFVPSGSLHKIENPDAGSTAVALIMILPDAYLKQHVPLENNFRFHLEKGSHASLEIVKMMKQMVRIINKEDPFKELLLEKELLGILHVLFSVADKETKDQSGNGKRLMDVLEYISMNCSGLLTVEKTAAVFGLQKNYFCRWFRQETGITFYQYLSRLRLENAMKLLQETEDSVLSCALNAGFVSERSLERWCRNVYHCTPGEFRRKNKSRGT